MLNSNCTMIAFSLTTNQYTIKNIVQITGLAVLLLFVSTASILDGDVRVGRVSLNFQVGSFWGLFQLNILTHNAIDHRLVT